MDSLEELAYAAALRRLDKQEHLVAELPGAIAVVLAAASVIASFLGQRASGALVGSSVVALAVVISASVYILAPRRRLVFAVSAGRIYDDAAGARLDPSGALRRIMYELHDGANRNDRLLVGMAIATRIAALALGVETALLSAAVGATIF